jgi:hypothetical protein
MSYTTRPRQEVGGYAIGSQEDIEDALTDLSAEMVLLLTRLRGTEVAQPNETTTSPRRAAGRLWEPQEALLDLLSNRREARCDVSDAEHLEQASL